MSKKIDMIGKRFGRLIVIAEGAKANNGKQKYVCKCDCGNITQVVGASLRAKNGTRSCGCIRNEKSSERMKTHGNSYKKTYAVWRNMKKRCYDPRHKAYPYYGGKGIKICDEWLNNFNKFEQFLIDNGYKENASFGEYTLDRLDSNEDYCPENCRIVSMKEQSLNKSSNHIIEFCDKEMTITEAAELMHLPNSIVFNRLNKGWSLERALGTPLRRTRIFEANGESHTIREWAAILHSSYSTINSRLKKQTMKEIYDDLINTDLNA